MQDFQGQVAPPQRLRPKGIADVVICIDCTASMGNCIEGVKAHVQDLVQGFEAEQSIRLDWRVRLVEYRDLTEGEDTIQYDFTTDISVFRNQVANLRATGGGNIAAPDPESTLDALFVALRSDWRAGCNKCIVVFTDAPCHEELHQQTVEVGQATDIDEIINLIYQTRARLFLFAPKFHIYDDLASAERVEYKAVPADTGLGSVDFAELMKFVGKSVSSSTEPAIGV